jgi:hypothetical protein
VGVVQGADDRFALGDVQREYLHPVPVGVLEAGGERVVVDQAGELQDQASRTGMPAKNTRSTMEGSETPRDHHRRRARAPHPPARRHDRTPHPGFLDDWRREGIAEEIDGRWRLTRTGRAMFGGWVGVVDLESQDAAA